MNSPEVKVNVAVGGFFEVRLDSSHSASTGYRWVLSLMPESVNLVDVRQESTSSAIHGGKTELVYVFVALKEDTASLKFNKIRPTAPQRVVDGIVYALTIVAGTKNQEQELEATLGGGKFFDSNQWRSIPAITALYMAPLCGPSATSEVAIPPYGFPLKVVHHPDQCLLAYGTPFGIAKTGEECVLKYGIPVHQLPISDDCRMKYGFPVVKYGFIVQGAAESGAVAVEYGFPVADEALGVQLRADDENCIIQYACPVEIIEDESRCLLKYGTPPANLLQLEGEACLVKYGMPVQVKQAGEGEVCHVIYGFPGGIASRAEECVLKYGVPVAAVPHSNCLVKYGFPDGPKN